MANRSRMTAADDRVKYSDCEGVAGRTKKEIGGWFGRGNRGTAMPHGVLTGEIGLNIGDITKQMGPQMTAMTAKVIDAAGWRSTVVALGSAGRIEHEALSAIIAVPRRGDRREQNRQKKDSGDKLHDGVTILSAIRVVKQDG